jgi:putative transposase
MSRANRYFLPRHVWHITHRCHQRKFLLKFARDRRRYLHWVFEAKKRFGLCVLDYVVTSNHVHLLVKDSGEDAIAQSMQLIAGPTAQEYNERKGSHGAFWEDRYYWSFSMRGKRNPKSVTRTILLAWRCIRRCGTSTESFFHR